MSVGDQAPTLVCIIGPPAVGKMTVGHEVCRHTGFKLFHGHVVADVLSPYFPFGTPSFGRLGGAWRQMFFEEALRAGLNVVTTVAWRFDVPADKEAIEAWLQPYTAAGRVVCVELLAPLEVRLARNRTGNRRRHKNPYWVTEEYLRDGDAAHRYDSGGAFPLDLPLLRLATERLPADVAAQRIIEHFYLPQFDFPGNAT